MVEKWATNLFQLLLYSYKAEDVDCISDPKSGTIVLMHFWDGRIRYARP